MAAKKTVETITIKPIVRLRTKIRIVGDTPLITHAWSEKAKRQMLEDQMGGKRVKKRPTKMPFDDFARSLHWITPMPTETITDPATNELREVVTEELFDQAIKDGAKFGFPANSIKLCANSAAYRMGYVKNQMALRGAYFIKSEYGDLCEIKGDIPQLRDDMVRVQMSTDIRFRPMFENWYIDAELEYNSSGQFSLEDIINCINLGGYAVGIGEWRPEHDGDFGQFHVEVIG